MADAVPAAAHGSVIGISRAQCMLDAAQGVLGVATRPAARSEALPA
jgi:hypothetical protein